MAFCSLGLVALGVIVLAVNDAMRFAEKRDGLVVTWESAPAASQIGVQGTPPAGLVARATTNHALTNLIEGSALSSESQRRMSPRG